MRALYKNQRLRARDRVSVGSLLTQKKIIDSLWGHIGVRLPPSVTRGARPHTKARGGSSEVPQPHHRDSPHPHSSSPCVSSPSPSSLRSSASPPHPRRPNSCRRLRAARARTPPPARARSPAATALEHIVSAHHRQLTSRGSYSCRSKGRRRRSNLWALC
jgi:hypothetical protein